ncbi:MAG: aldehyde dehydrogenase family protein [Flavobacteriaceae bacterium]
MKNNISQILNKLGIENNQHGCSNGSDWFGSGDSIISYSPVDGSKLGNVSTGNKDDYNKLIDNAQKAFISFRKIPAPKRGELVRQLGNKIRDNKAELGELVSLEMGKSLQEGLGEVQEMIDICDFAVGLSRQLYGLTMHSERPNHRMYEQYHPLGIIGIISAFNFPVAVWSWNVALAWVCGNVCIWKPSEKTPLCSIVCQKLIADVLRKNNISNGVSCLINGDSQVGKWMSEDKRINLLSATGSTRMGKDVAQKVGARLGKSLLELGGNNAIIVTPSVDIKQAVINIVFGAVGTCGQRCTTTRRIIVHESIISEIKNELIKAYGQLKIGNPLDESNHVGPLIDLDAVNHYNDALNEVKKQGGKLIVNGGVYEGSGYESGCYVKPAIAEINNEAPIVQKETFAPILYIIKYEGDINNAIKIMNDVNQGLSSSIMTENLKESEIFLSASGSDCGIANVNIGTSGAEIGGAFGGEKDTGGGRESGSDAWKVYMRRQTNTINYSNELTLAQGINFDV